MTETRRARPVLSRRLFRCGEVCHRCLGDRRPRRHPGASPRSSAARPGRTVRRSLRSRFALTHTGVGSWLRPRHRRRRHSLADAPQRFRLPGNARCAVELALPILAPAASVLQRHRLPHPLVRLHYRHLRLRAGRSHRLVCLPRHKTKAAASSPSQTQWPKPSMPEVEPARKANPQPAPATQDEPLTTSQVLSFA